MRLSYATVLLCILAAAARRTPNGFTRRFIKFKSQEQCKDQGLGTWNCTGTMVRSGVTSILNGICHWPIDIDENIQFRVLTALFKDGQYHEGYIDLTISGCEQFEQISDGFLKSLFATSGIKNNQCPYPKGTYQYKDYLMGVDTLMPDSTPNGLYKLSLSVMDKKDNLLGCVQCNVEIAPSNRKKKNY